MIVITKASCTSKSAMIASTSSSKIGGMPQGIPRSLGAAPSLAKMGFPSVPKSLGPAQPENIEQPRSPSSPSDSSLVFYIEKDCRRFVCFKKDRQEKPRGYSCFI